MVLDFSSIQFDVSRFESIDGIDWIFNNMMLEVSFMQSIYIVLLCVGVYWVESRDTMGYGVETS